ncbi:MAG: ROK family protein [Clostridiaceae bacterium]
MKYIAIDIGGSSVKTAIVTEEGSILEKSSFKGDKNNFENFKASMVDVILHAKEVHDIKGVAISAPGGVDSDSGIIGGSSALPCIHGPNFKTLFGEELGLKAEIENDANCAALGEVWKGAAKDNKDVLFVVCGTGIGGAVVKNKMIHKGDNLHGGEFGYSILEKKIVDGKLVFKTWSHLGAMGALVKMVAEVTGEDPETLDGKEIFRRADEGDSVAIKAIDDFYLYNATGIFNIQYTYDPEKILIGGAISSRPDFIDKINEKLDLIIRALPVAKVKPTLVKCAFENDANLLGALYNYLQRNGSSLAG